MFYPSERERERKRERERERDRERERKGGRRRKRYIFSTVCIQQTEIVFSIGTINACQNVMVFTQ